MELRILRRKVAVSVDHYQTMCRIEDVLQYRYTPNDHYNKSPDAYDWHDVPIVEEE